MISGSDRFPVEISKIGVFTVLLSPAIVTSGARFLIAERRAESCLLEIVHILGVVLGPRIKQQTVYYPLR